MLETEPFVEQIIANPHDDTARLIFADYLEEHGDPRAEMIRLQFEMAELDRFDTSRQELRRRELKLLKKYGVFGRPPAVAKVIGHHGGFVDAVEITVTRFLKLQDELFRSAPVRQLSLKRPSVRFDEIRESPWLSQLSTLVLKQNEASSEQYAELLSCPRLNRLKSLRVAASEMPNQCVADWVNASNLQTVEELSLPAYQLSHESCQAVAESSVLRNLKSLYVGGLQNDTSLSVLAESPNCEALEELRLGGEMSEAGLQALQNGPYCRRLKSLDVALRTERWDEAFDVPAPLDRLRHLSLSLRNSYREPNGPSTPIDLQHLVTRYPDLETLDLGYNELTNSSVQALAGSPLLKSLKKLTLSGNSLTRVGVEMIVESPWFHPGLKLNLRSNQLSEDDIQGLRDSYGKSLDNVELE